MILLELSKAVSKKPKKKSKLFEFGEFSEVGIDYIFNSDAFINVQHGAIRSGKTVNSIIPWLKHINDSPYDEFLQTGKTRRSLYRNVLRTQFSIMDSFGIDYTHRVNDGYIEVEGNIIWLMGFINESVVDIIRGMTIGGWNADEVNTYPKSTIDETLDRMSADDAKAYWTLNPDSPAHFIYGDYLHNKSMIEAGDVKIWNYTLYDNLNLSKEYIARTERRYPSGTVGHKRKILGLPVIAEGCIYDGFMESQHTFHNYEIPYGIYQSSINKYTGEIEYTLKSLNYDYYVIGTDWGAGNVTIFGLFGIKRTNHGNEYHLLDEYYYDVVKEHRGLKVSEYADHAMELLNFQGFQLPLTAFFTPHDSSSLRNELNTRFYQGKKIPTKTHTPDTLGDIDDIKEVIGENRFKINIDNCTASYNCMLSYAWDPKAQRMGLDAPLKVNDHPADMWRGPIIGTRFNKNGKTYTQTRKRYAYNMNDILQSKGI